MAVVADLYKHAGKYDLIFLDPPWPYHGSQTKMGAAGNHYKLMKQDQINDLPVLDLLKPNGKGLILTWGTWPKLSNAMEALDCWGAPYRGCAFNWFKSKNDGETLLGSQGPRASVTKPNSEFVLWGSPALSGRPLKIENEKIPQLVETVVDVKHEKLGHSIKPDCFYEYVDQMYPSAKKLEMFARRDRKGWDVWGDEA